MSALFLKIVNMSISASWLVLAVLVLRFVLKKAPRWVNVLLWGIVAVRLICPFSIESALSLIPSAETISPEIMMDRTPEIATGMESVDRVVNPIITGTFAPEPIASANPLQILIPVFALVWITGMCILALYIVISYWRLRRRVREAVILRENIFRSEHVGSPFVLGIIKPGIYLPYHMAEQELEHVVAHEQAHIRRKDHLWKPLGFLLLTIHWFNPLMWLSYVLLCRDIELACDEKVIRELGNEQRADYSQALVACSVNRRMIAACPLAFGEVGVKERVKSVLKYKKPAFWVIVVSLIACAVVAVCFLTNPMGFQFNEMTHTIVSANHFDMRNADDAVAVEMNPAQISELSSRLAGVKNTKKSNEYGGFTPGYQISALLEDGTYIRISSYSLSENDMVDIEWNGDRYVVSDSDFQDYLSRICAGVDVSDANIDAGRIIGYSALYSEELINEAFNVAEREFYQRFDNCTLIELRYDEEIENRYGDIQMNWWSDNGQELITVYSTFETSEDSSGACVWYLVRTEDKKSWEYATWEHLGKSISLNDIIMLSQKGYDLTWSDFEQYRYAETGSGLYIRVYEINEMYELWIGGSWPDEDPMYIWLTLADDLNTRIDIRDGGVEEFITKDHSETLLNRAIYDAILDHNVYEKTVGLNNCASFIMLDKEEISGTPVVGSTDHVGVVTVYGLALYQGYDLVDGELREEAGSHIPVAITFDVLNGKYRLKEYWTPRDGTYYAPDIREKFPDKIEDEAMNTQKYIAAQKQECYVQAMRHNGVEVSDPDQQPLSAKEQSAAVNAIFTNLRTGWWNGNPLENCAYESAAFECLHREENGNIVNLYGYGGYFRWDAQENCMEHWLSATIVTLDTGTQQVLDLWWPGDGAAYESAILDRFPESIASTVAEPDPNRYATVRNNLMEASKESMVSANQQSGSGQTRRFGVQDLRLEVTDVLSTHKTALLAEGIQLHEYVVVSCTPESKITVLDAGMSDPTYAEDGKPHPQWGLYYTGETDRTRITDETGTVPVTSALEGIYNLEASLFVIELNLVD